MTPPRRRALPFAALLVLALATVAASCRSEPAPGIAESACCDAAVLLRADDMPAVASLVSSLWRGETNDVALPARFATPADGVYAAFRVRGERLTHGWERGGTVVEALRRLLERSRKHLGKRSDDVDTIEIDLSHSYRDLRIGDRRDARILFANIRRGVNGLELAYGARVSRYAPTWSISTNRDNARWIDLFRQENALDEKTFRSLVRTRMFDAEQVLVFLRPEPRARLLFRGNEVVPLAAVGAETTRKTADLAIRWLVDNVHEDGRLTYKYWPSAGEESAANNMIRQWMATIALEAAARERNDPALWNRIERNIDYDLAHFYREDGPHGLIEWEGEVKLGAVALGTIALVGHPRREKWARQEKALRATVDDLWNPDGSFDTFYEPRGRNDNQNFYPGEALLLWSILYAEKRDPKLLARFWKSFEYYREWHLDPRHRNPAFIPWHTQADYNLWRITKDERLRVFVFEMNDWLLSVQQWDDDARYPDTNGRFYDPNRPFGPPHASSTGAYLEGLIDAFALARESGDTARAESYRVAILRGLRSVMQLQFVDEIDMFYVSHKKRRYVLGGLRTNEYDNEIRCDNVQHNLLAMLEILERFAPEDYRVTATPDGRLEIEVGESRSSLHHHPQYRSIR